jgi:hypothetical protein
MTTTGDEFTLPSGRKGRIVEADDRAIQVDLSDAESPEAPEHQTASTVALQTVVALLVVVLGTVALVAGVIGLVSALAGLVCGAWAGLATLGVVLLVTGFLMGL